MPLRRNAHEGVTRVQAGVYNEFAELLTDLLQRVNVGDPTHSSTHMGPLINGARVAWAQQHVDDAIELGAHTLCGGGVPREQQAGSFYEPTLLANARGARTSANGCCAALQTP